MHQWSTWSGSVRGWTDDEQTPEDLGQLVGSIRALSVQRGDRIHAEGSKWAFSAPAFSDRLIIDTRRLNSFPAEVQGAVIPTHVPGKLRVAVHAGIRIRELYTALYAGEGVPPLPGGESDAARWVLPVLGGAGGQSIAGAINTGTHGGDPKRPPLSDGVAAMIVVGTGGVVRVIQRRQTPAVDVDRFRAALEPLIPGLVLEDRSDDATLAAAVVSVGRFGVVYAYVLEVVDEKDWLLLEKRYTESWRADTRPALSSRLQEALDTDGFFEIALNPNRRPDRDYTSYVTTHHRMLARDIPAESTWVLDPALGSGMRLFQMLCGTSITPELRTLRIALAEAAALLPTLPLLAGLSVAGIALLPPPLALIAPVLVATVGLAIIPLAGLLISVSAKLGTIGPDHMIGDVIADILNEVTDLGFPGLAEVVTGALLDSQQGPRIVHGTRFEIADFFDYDHPDCYRGDSIEVFFDAMDTPALLDKIDRLLDLFDEMRANGVAFGGYFSLRFMARSEASLGMSRWERTCSIEVAAIRELRGNERIFDRIREFTLRNGGVVHWGQINKVSAGAIAAAFGPDLASFRRKLFETEGSSLLFRNQFTQDHGLEVPLAAITGADPWEFWETLELTTHFGAAVGNAGFGRPLEVFAVDSDGLVQVRERRIDGSPDSAWRSILPQPVQGRPVVARSHDGRRELFVRNLLHTPQRRVQHTWELGRPGGVYANWDTLGGPLNGIEIAGDPAVIAHTDGRLEWFAQTTPINGHTRLAHSWAWFEGSYWNDVWTLGDAPIGTQPSACNRIFGGGQLVVVAASGGAVLVMQQVGLAATPAWTEWTELMPASGPALTASVSGPVVIEVPGSGIHVLAMDGRGEVFTSTDSLAEERLSWSPWQMLPSTAGSDFLAPATRLTAIVTDRVNLFGLSQRGQILQSEFLPGSGVGGSGWSGWQNLGGEISGDLAAGVHADGRVEIVGRRSDSNELWARRQRTPGSWT